MPLISGQEAAVTRIEDAYKKAQQNSQGADNTRIIAEAIVGAMIFDLLPKGKVTGKTLTQSGPQDLQEGKIT